MINVMAKVYNSMMKKQAKPCDSLSVAGLMDKEIQQLETMKKTSTAKELDISRCLDYGESSEVK